jgi:thiamine-phosphate pyrophosphorylase
MKAVAREDILRVGRVLRALTQGTETRFIVNDDVEVARLVEADGLHVGQTDLGLAAARELWCGSNTKCFGLSTHNEEQARLAIRDTPDYIGVGPVYRTPTKRNADPVLGVVRASAIIRHSPISAVAIGGIDRDSLPEILRAGIRNYAVVRYVCQRARPKDAIFELIDTAGEVLAKLSS